MPGRTVPAAFVALVLVGAGPASAAAKEEGTRTLSGLYTSRFTNGPQRLQVEFRPAPGESSADWQVKFFFRFQSQSHVYRGDAWGNLDDGELRGQVQNEGGSRTFTFRCEFDDKKRCKGRHAELFRGGEQDTGTITLRE